MEAATSAEQAAMDPHPVPRLGIRYERRLTRAGEDPYDTVEWGTRDVVAGDFSQSGVEAPTSWSDQSVGIVAKLYFATIDCVREHSVRQMIQRVVGKIVGEMSSHGYFGKLHDGDDLATFSDELTYALLHQYVTFNSPVWFNLGVPGRKPYCSACYLLATEDKMIGPDSITDWWTNEALIFKSGAGSGINISTIRGSMEPLSTGGLASGPVAYMRPADAGAGTLKSGGAHRRAAKLVRLDADHPDIVDFIGCKVREDERMRALSAAGFDLDPTTPEGERNVAECTSFQNENLSIGAPDEFMRRAVGEDDPEWSLIARKTGEVVATVSAPELLRSIAESAWRCADPGMQFDDTINSWHTTPSVGRITTSNPCGETYLNDDSACNLASLNVLRYISSDGTFDVDGFCHHVDIMVTAMDATCSFSELPTSKIERNTRDLRQLGLGFSNLGAALMAQGLPYDSDEGRDFAAAMTALMTGRAYLRSAHLAEHLGSFKHFEANRDAMMRVVDRHLSCAYDYVHSTQTFNLIWIAAIDDWNAAQQRGNLYGFRNSQVTICQPGGTTSFMLGCDTTGVEPAFSLVTYKGFAGGGSMVMINGAVERALYHLGYDDTIVARINHELGDGAGDIVQFLRPEHADVFRTAVGDHAIEPLGHVRMVAAIQLFLSQAVSKTCNMPHNCTVEDVEQVYVEAWRRGLKGISIYRDGSKATQVLRTKPKAAMGLDSEKWTLDYYQDVPIVLPPIRPSSQMVHRRRMPREREARVIKFTIDGHKGYLTIGLHEDGTVGEIFLNGIGKDGSTLRGIADAWATDFSIGLQHGVPLETLVRKHAHVRFPPEGPTGDPDVPVATSIPDFVVRKIAALFLDADLCEEMGVMSAEVRRRVTERLDAQEATGTRIESLLVSVDQHVVAVPVDFGQACRQCGASMVRTGSCWACPTCFNSTGCG